MLTLVGVGHVFDIKDQIRSIILTKRPDIVAIELDHARFTALHDKKGTGNMPIIYRLAAHFQRRIAGEYGVEAGDEMLAAVNAAKESGAGISLIDMDMARVFAELRKNITFEEQVKLGVAAFASLFVRKKTVERELARYQEHEAEFMEEMGKELPNLKLVLIDKRNEFMARNLRQISERYNNILAVVGDGHVPGMAGLLEDMSPELIRLAEVRNWEPPEESSIGGGPMVDGSETKSSSVSYSFDVEL